MHSIFPFIGFYAERHRLEEAIKKKESVLIIGPAGSGKTALIQAALGGLPKTQGIIHIQYAANLHRLLMELTRSLFAAKHRKLLERARPGADADKWLSHQTSIHLKGLLWTALKVEPRTIILDGIDRGSFPMYRFLQRLYFADGMTIVAAARNTASLGALSRLFWDPARMIHLRPLNNADAEHLFDVATDHFRLRHLDLEEFREKVLESAQGNPGQIIAMCKLAADPLYVSGKHIKFAPLRIDVLMRFLG